jgi:hypothetical protein
MAIAWIVGLVFRALEPVLVRKSSQILRRPAFRPEAYKSAMRIKL